MIDLHEPQNVIMILELPESVEHNYIDVFVLTKETNGFCAWHAKDHIGCLKKRPRLNKIVWSKPFFDRNNAITEQTEAIKTFEKIVSDYEDSLVERSKP